MHSVQLVLNPDILQKQSNLTIELASLNPAHSVKTLEARNVDWMARDIWASQ
jgi:hypothetical protein